MKIYIQSENGVPAFDFCYSMYIEALHKGFTKDKIILYNDVKEIPAHRNLIMIGCIEDTKAFLKKLNIEIPDAITAYDFLFQEGFIKRQFTIMTLEEFKIFDVNNPYFIKPLHNVKAFPSGVSSKRSILPLILSDYKGSWDIDILVSEVIEPVSEYRVFWRRSRNGEKQIAGMKHYQGDPMIYPDNEYIYSVLKSLQRCTDLPASLTVDFAVLSDGRTEVIELNDAWSSGSYGLEGEAYWGFYMDRWYQLMKNY